MDNNAIDQILSAINGTNDDKEDLAVFMRDLPRRSPSTRPTSQSNFPNSKTTKSNTNSSVINRPLDPVKSVSSTENMNNSDDVIELEYQRSNSNQKDHEISHMQSSNMRHKPAKQTFKNKIIESEKNDSSLGQSNILENNSMNDPNELNNEQNAIVSQNSHLTNIMGYNIPTTTIYFIVILIVIAIGLYFLTAEKKQPIKNDHDKNKQKEDIEE